MENKEKTKFFISFVNCGELIKEYFNVTKYMSNI